MSHLVLESILYKWQHKIGTILFPQVLVDVTRPQVLVLMLPKATCGRHRASQPLVRWCTTKATELDLVLDLPSDTMHQYHTRTNLETQGEFLEHIHVLGVGCMLSLKLRNQHVKTDLFHFTALRWERTKTQSDTRKAALEPTSDKAAISPSPVALRGSWHPILTFPTQAKSHSVQPFPHTLSSPDLWHIPSHPPKGPLLMQWSQGKAPASLFTA